MRFEHFYDKSPRPYRRFLFQVGTERINIRIWRHIWTRPRGY